MEQTRDDVQKKASTWVMAALMLGIFISSMDQTIVSTAMGTIVSDLGGLDQFVWVTSAYLVAEMAGMPIFGKLSDMYGRKRFFIFGLSMFLFGSILCGTAGSMVQLSIYRALQGIGGGSLMPIAFAIIFDLVPLNQRGKMSGMFGAVFGLSSVLGPLLGAFITDHLNWHWVFYINVPLGLIAVSLISVFYKESRTHSREAIDWGGAGTLVAATVSLMFAVELGGNKYDWASPVIIGLFASFAVFFILFLFAETKAAEPIISFKMFHSRLFASSNLVAVIFGVPFVVAIVMLPIYIQGVFGGSATNAGLMLLPMMVGVTAASVVGGIMAQHVSYRNIMLLHGLILLIGLSLAGTMSSGTSFWVILIYMVIIGYGVGASFAVLGMAAIHGFKPSQFGAANATLAFVREFGMTVGITIFGTIQSHILSSKLRDAFAGHGKNEFLSHMSNPRALLSPEARAHMPGNILTQLKDLLASSITQTFLWALIPATFAILLILLMPGDKLAINRNINN
ncbi:DHA2 family efflux MFS transporter permease subunit [Sporolactobacillus shoreae]|uniref:DHA2 family efflux MFS transporter permease subunit n=1 Tax=Sporolactobacillus shoreae TaxID=1465501 RepID=A0A4Z0GTX9_9BACL|nr:MDR family MFS transporter [Sporolactobacillus shoreae]TGB00440.1 DHA2 family efflux MFS transporter permease subunit [Sporolactobacillus shoreae]